MAILSASELKASREAAEAGVAAVSDPDADSAIRSAQAKLNLALGYRVENDDTSITFLAKSGDVLVVPERVRTISGISDTFPGGSVTTVTEYTIRSSGFKIYRRAGWFHDNTVQITGTFGYADSDDRYILAKEFVLLLAVRYLQSTGSGNNNVPAPPPGGFLTGLQTEGAGFTFFTPEGDTTGYRDLDNLLDQIGRHPNRVKGLHTIPLSSGIERDLGPEATFLGLETP